MAKRQKPLYGGGLSHYNRTVPTIIPPTVSQNNGILYDVFENEGDSSLLEQVLDEGDIIQVTTEMQSMWRELVDAYRKDELYKLALVSRKRAKGGGITLAGIACIIRREVYATMGESIYPNPRLLSRDFSEASGGLLRNHKAFTFQDRAN